MTTDEERREVARRLRHSWVNVPDRNPVRHQLRVLFEIYSAVGLADDDGADAIDLFARLADLIEPSGHGCVPGECPLNVRHDNDRIDRERLLAIATLMAADSVRSVKQGSSVSPVYILHAARNIAEACGETFGSIRNRELAEWGTSIVPKETIVDRDALLALEDEMFEDATGLALISQLEKNEELQDLQSTMAKALMDYARRIRKALGACDG